MSELGLEHGVGHGGLDQIVDPGRAAALVGIRERHELDSGDRGEDGGRRIGDALRVQEMTRRVIGDARSGDDAYIGPPRRGPAAGAAR